MLCKDASLTGYPCQEAKRAKTRAGDTSSYTSTYYTTPATHLPRIEGILPSVPDVAAVVVYALTREGSLARQLVAAD